MTDVQEGRALKVEGGTVLDMLVEFGQRLAPWESEEVIREVAVEYLTEATADTREE